MGNCILTEYTAVVQFKNAGKTAVTEHAIYSLLLKKDWLHFHLFILFACLCECICGHKFMYI